MKSLFVFMLTSLAANAQAVWQTGPANIYGSAPCPDGRWAVVQAVGASNTPTLGFWNPVDNTVASASVTLPPGYSLRGMSGNFALLPDFDSQTLVCGAGGSVYALLFPSGVLTEYQPESAIARLLPGPVQLLLSDVAHPTSFQTPSDPKSLYFREVLGIVRHDSTILAEVWITPSSDSSVGAEYAYLDVNSLPQANILLHESSDILFLPCSTDTSTWYLDDTSPRTFMGQFYRLSNNVSARAYPTTLKYPNRTGDEYSSSYACNSTGVVYGYYIGSNIFVDRLDDELRPSTILQTSDISFAPGSLALSDDGTVMFTSPIAVNMIGTDGKTTTLFHYLDFGIGVDFHHVSENNGAFGLHTRTTHVYMGNQLLSLYLAHIPKLASTLNAGTGQAQVFAPCTGCYGSASATVAGKSVAVMPVSGGFALQLPPLAAGNYPVSIVLTGDLKSSVALSAQLAVTAISGPFVSRLGVANASSSALADLAPGEWISIYGSNLAPQLMTARSVPFGTKLGGAQVLINGQAVPLWFVSPTQINALVPNELTGSSATVQITSNGSTSVLATVPVAAQFPGLSESNGDTILLSAHGLISQLNPLQDGDEVTLYGTGFGPTIPLIATNQPAPSNPLAALVAPVAVSFEGMDSLVRFTGLSPGGYDLFQMNLRVSLPVKRGSGAQRLQGTATVGNTSSTIATWY